MGLNVTTAILGGRLKVLGSDLVTIGRKEKYNEPVGVIRESSIKLNINYTQKGGSCEKIFTVRKRRLRLLLASVQVDSIFKF